MQTATPTAAAIILAIDLGKYKSVACVHDRTTAQPRFDSIPTSRAELLRLLEKATEKATAEKATGSVPNAM